MQSQAIYTESVFFGGGGGGGGGKEEEGLITWDIKLSFWSRHLNGTLNLRYKYFTNFRLICNGRNEMNDKTRVGRAKGGGG